MDADLTSRFPLVIRRLLMGEDANASLALSLAADTMHLDASAGGQVAVLRPESLCAAVFGAEGALLFATPGWAASGFLFNPDLAATAAKEQVAILASGEQAQARSSGLMVAVPCSTLMGWRLPADVLHAASRADAHMLFIAIAPVEATASLQASCRAWGLNTTQTRIVEAVMRTGSIRPAATMAGMSYDTAREAVSAAMDKLGVQRLPALLDRLTMATIGVWPVAEGEETADPALLGDMLGLSERQSRLALCLALGLSRAEAAAACGLSMAVVKNELKQIFIVLGVASASGMVRRLAEARTLSVLAGLTGSDVVWADESVSPLRYVERADGSRIAVSDYGPSRGAPVLVLHSSMTTRPVAGPILRALHDAKRRVIAIDRPGYGLSDMVEARCPFEAAAEDAETVLDALGLARIDVVARAGAQAALAMWRRCPERMGRVVLVNPDPPNAFSGKGTGVLGRVKTLFLRHPSVLGGFARLLSSQYSPAKAETIMRRAVEGFPADEAFLANPRNVADYYRASRMFQTGRIKGYLAEQLAFATMDEDAPLPGTHGWTVLLGEAETLHDPAAVAAYWRRVLPDAAMKSVPGAGLFLAMTHVDEVLAALRAD